MSTFTVRARTVDWQAGMQSQLLPDVSRKPLSQQEIEESQHKAKLDQEQPIPAQNRRPIHWGLLQEVQPTLSRQASHGGLNAGQAKSVVMDANKKITEVRFVSIAFVLLDDELQSGERPAKRAKTIKVKPCCYWPLVSREAHARAPNSYRKQYRKTRRSHCQWLTRIRETKPSGTS